MNKKVVSIIAVIIIVVFIGYIIVDTASPEKEKKTEKSEDIKISQDKWFVSKILNPEAGQLKAVAVSQNGRLFLGGDAWVACYDKDLKLIWNLITPKPVTSMAVSGDSLFASTVETILLINSVHGVVKDEWGPYEDNSIITSVASNNSYVAYADAGNKIVVILNKKGELRTIIGKSGEPFIVPSPYFDVALDHNNTLFIANTGNRRIEKRSVNGDLINFFGLPGTAPEAFSGCCNPAHFVLTNEGFITAEKGINRIKIITREGKFVEFVSSENKFMPSIPLDLATADGETIFAANPADGKLYVFKRR
jgi:hypothetical protein